MDIIKEWIHLAKVGLGVGILGFIVNAILTMVFMAIGISIVSLNNPTQMISAGIASILLFILVALPASGWVAEVIVKNPLTR